MIGAPVFVVDAFRRRDHAAAVLGVGRLHVGEELVDDEGALRQVDQVRAVAGELARQRRGGGEEAGVAAHDHRAIDARQRGVVEVGAGEGLGDEARRRRIAGRMVEADEVVVDRLRDMDRADLFAGLGRLFRDDAHGVGGVVAADVAERVDLVRLQHLEDFLAVLDVGLVAGRAERGGRRGGDGFEIGGGLLGQVDEVFFDDAAHAAHRAVDARDVGKAPRLERHASQRLVDHRRRPTALRDQNLMRHRIVSLRNHSQVRTPGALFARPAFRAARRDRQVPRAIRRGSGQSRAFRRLTMLWVKLQSVVEDCVADRKVSRCTDRSAAAPQGARQGEASMDGLLVLLGLAVIAAVVLGPIGFFAAMGHGGRLRVVERTLDDVRRRLIEAERRLAVGAAAPAAQRRARRRDPQRRRAKRRRCPMTWPRRRRPIAPTAADLPPPIPVTPPPTPTAAAEPPLLPEPVAAAEASEPPASPLPPRASLEERLGARWTVWVGGVATGLGALLLVRYAAEQGYFGPGARVLLGLALAAVLLGLGERLRRAEGAIPALGAAAARANAPADADRRRRRRRVRQRLRRARALRLHRRCPRVPRARRRRVWRRSRSPRCTGRRSPASGLVGAEVAPLLVSSDHPSPWPVVLYLLPVAIAAYALARLRRWLWLALATAGGGFAWSFLLSGQSDVAHALDAYHAALAMLVLQAALAAAFIAVAPHRGGADEDAGFDPAASGVLAAFSALAVLALVQPPGAFGFDAWWIAAAGALVAVLAIAGVLAATVAAAIALAGAFSAGGARRLAGRGSGARARSLRAHRPLALAAAALSGELYPLRAGRRTRRRRARRLAAAARRTPVGAPRRSSTPARRA